MGESGFSVMNRIYNAENMVGFKIFFENGYGVSFVFGGESLTDPVKMKQTNNSCDFFCKDAEVAVLNSKHEIIPFRKDGAIKPHVKPEEIPQIISWVMKK